MILSIILSIALLFAMAGFEITPLTVGTTIIGSILSWGLTKYLKEWTGVYSIFAVILTFIICVLVALVSTIGVMFYNGESVTLDVVSGQAFAVFTLATALYHLIPKDKQ